MGTRTESPAAWILTAMVSLAAGCVGVALIGPGASPEARVAELVFTLPLGVLVMGVLALASWGWGRPFEGVLRGSSEAPALRIACGLALLLTALHLAGLVGAYRGAVLTGLVGGGVLLAASEAVSGLRAGRALVVNRPSWWWLAAVPGAAVLMVAACNAPGWLWDSEFAGYDALSYHLQLPKEWLAGARVWPAEHSVYSFLPGYAEVAFGAAMAAAAGPASWAPIDAERLLEAGRWVLIGPQFVHATMTLLAAWLVGRCAAVMLGARGHVEAGRARVLAATAGAAVLCVPWVLVVGSLAYNEMGVVLFGAAALLAAWDPAFGAGRRGALAGLLVGAACCCKPTAMLFITPMVGLALLLRSAPSRTAIRSGAIAAVWAMLIGGVMISPWLVRNWLDSGNPVFPQLAGVFGHGHWTDEQAERFAHFHREHLPLMTRLRLLVWTDPAAGADAFSTERWRGFANAQWGVWLPVVGLAGAVVMLLRRAWHVAGFVLVASLVMMILAWLAATHLQSRFLIPAVVPIALGCAALAAWSPARAARAWPVALGVVLAASGGFAVITFARERDGAPNALLVGGFESRRAVVDALHPPPEVLLAALAARGEPVRVLLVGGATPTYMSTSVVYATAYDKLPLATAIERHPDDPNAWTATLAAAGCTHALIDFGELSRLKRSGFLDPALDPERVARWATTLGPPLAGWSGGRVVLFELRDQPRPTAPSEERGNG